MTHIHVTSPMNGAADRTEESASGEVSGPFLLLSPAETVVAHGIRTVVPLTLGCDGGARASAFFAAREGGPAILTGARRSTRTRPWARC